MRYASRRLILGLALLTASIGACVSEELSTDHAALISDQAHGGGTPGFYFLAPLVPQPHPTGTFEPRLEPVVQIDRVHPVTGATLANVVTFNSQTRVDGTKVRVHRRRGYYVVRWRTAHYDLSLDATYRIRVLVAGRELGFADVDVVRTRREMRNVDRDEFVPLKLDGTLPIKFRIETRAVDQDGDGVFDWIDNCPTVANGPGAAQPPGAPQNPPYGCDNEADECDPDEGDCGGGGGGQVDTDGDGIGDACECQGVTCGPADACHAPGTCQPTTGTCAPGAPLPDGDGDGTCDPVDACPADPVKTAPGVCGCGVADRDSDGDGAADCLDACPADPVKTAPGTCGCGVADRDGDGDGAADCVDACPADPVKTAPGTCGCGAPDVPGCNVCADTGDLDNDGTLNCVDGCRSDPLKTAPGVCGCGTAEVDADGDGIIDCVDQCPGDSGNTCVRECRLSPAQLGDVATGVPSSITIELLNDELVAITPDGDAMVRPPGAVVPVPRRFDVFFGATPPWLRPVVRFARGSATEVRMVLTAVAPGSYEAEVEYAGEIATACLGSPLVFVAECGAATDQDGDGTPDCEDGCPLVAGQIEANACGCGIAEVDADGDTIPDCLQ